MIHRASLELEVDSVDDAVPALSAIAEARGGFVVTSQVNHPGLEAPSLSAVLRVPAREFTGALAAVRSAARQVTAESISGEDVTDQVVDLESRLHAQRALEAQYLEILKRAQSVADALQVQAKLGEVQTEIERAQGQLHLLADRVELSTITLCVRGARPGIVANVRAAIRDGVAVTSVLTIGGVRIAGALGPFAAFLGMPFIAVRSLRRRRPA